jgi:hypothetical protein
MMNVIESVMEADGIETAEYGGSTILIARRLCDLDMIGGERGWT